MLLYWFGAGGGGKNFLTLLLIVHITFDIASVLMQASSITEMLPHPVYVQKGLVSSTRLCSFKANIILRKRKLVFLMHFSC